MEISSRAYWYTVTSNFASVLVKKLSWFGCIWSPIVLTVTLILFVIYKGDEEEEGDKSCKPAHAHIHTNACNLSVSLLSYTVLHISAHIHSRNTQTCCSWDSLLCQGTHTAWGYNTKLYSVAAVASVLYGQLQGHWYHVGIGHDFFQAFRAHTCMRHT